MNAKKVHKLLAQATMHAREAVRLVEEAAEESRPEYRSNHGSITGEVAEFLEKRAAWKFTADQIAEDLGEKRVSVSVSLNRLVNAGRAERVEPGVFRWKAAR